MKVRRSKFEKSEPQEETSSRSRERSKIYTLPTTPSKASNDLWSFAFHIYGHRKIGKTTLVNSGGTTYFFQFDKLQTGIEIIEEMPDCWSDPSGRTLGYVQIVEKMEKVARSGKDFPYDRLAVDGVDEWYQMCLAHVCDKLGAEHPADLEYGKGWNAVKKEFLEGVNRLLRLQASAGVGIVFISGGEWKTIKPKGKDPYDRFESTVSGQAERIVNAKVDAWFAYDFVDEMRVLYLLGSDEIGAGHRIDGRFFTKSGFRIRELYMGDDETDAEFGLAQLEKAFRNEIEHASIAEMLEAKKSTREKRASRRSE